MLASLGMLRRGRQRAYGLAAAAALSRAGVTSRHCRFCPDTLLDRWATAYHLDDLVHFPP